MEFALTFLEGLVTFISPCILPMLPVYVAYFAGDAEYADQDSIGRTLLSAIGFVLGFTVPFSLLGAFAGRLGMFLVEYQRPLQIVSGIVVILLGLNYLGIFKIPILERTFKPESDVIPRGFLNSFLFGIVFAFTWTPCVGTFLTAALSVAANSASVLKGIALLAVYSLGLGLPFILSALLINQLESSFSWVKSHYTEINIASGLLLVVVGVLIATGHLSLWLSMLTF